MRPCTYRAAILMAGLCAAALSLSMPAPVLAEAQAQAQAAVAEGLGGADPFIPPAASRRGTVVVREQTLPYVAEASETLLRDPQGRARATLSSVSYVVEADAPRPVTFLFNGGPGGATIALREGLAPRVTAGAGPRGAFRFVDNPDSLIDATDLVFADAPGVGYGRFFGEDASAAYWGVDEDAAAITDFILAWLRARGREGAPVFLVGESYAGVRVGLVAERLAAIPAAPRLAGVVLVSPSTVAGRGEAPGVRTMDAAVLALPTLAATARHHGRGAYAAMAVEDLADQAWAFAGGPYAQALAQGDALPEARRRETARALSAYTGLSERLILDNDLKVPAALFVRELLADQGLRIGGSDGRAKASRAVTERRSPPYDDPSTSPYTLTYDQTGAVEALFREEIGYRPVNGYVRLSIDANRAWNWNRAAGVEMMPALFGELMRRDTRLHVTLMTGYYDLTIPYARPVQDYLAADLPSDRFDHRVLVAGHAVFSDPDARAAATDHLRRFYAKAMRAW
ncbi:MAG: hypothetical protein J0I52_05200 [Bordetella sp.]|nr:hypothetical protein [Bordetella sp.]